jgi:hypothetical protein
MRGFADYPLNKDAMDHVPTFCKTFVGMLSTPSVMMIFIYFLLAFPLQAQEASEIPPLPEVNSPVTVRLRADNETPLLGEGFELTVTISAPSNTEILEWLEFPEDEALEILEIGEIEEVISGGTVTYTRIYQVILWKTGEYLSPEMLLPYRLNNAPTSWAIVSSFAATVPSQVDNPESAEVKSSVQPIDLPYISTWVYVGIIAAIVLLVMIIARILQFSKRQVTQVVVTTPTQMTIAQLEDLKLQNLPPATIYQLVADNLREYLQLQFEINAVEMTTVELNDVLRDNSPLSKEQKRRLQQVLEQADLVKFARFQPDDIASTRLVNFAIKWLREAGRQNLD